VLGRQSNWNAEGARLGADLFRRQKNGRGLPIAASVEELSQRVLTTLTRLSAEAVLETAFAEDGLDGAAMVAHGLVQRAVEGAQGIARVQVALDRPVIALGASASLHYAGLPALVGNACVTPPDADVANALGAIVGQVRVRVEATVSQPVEGRFRVVTGENLRDCSTEEEALHCAEREARAAAERRARAAGTDNAEVSMERNVRVAVIEGRRMFIDRGWPARGVRRRTFFDDSSEILRALSVERGRSLASDPWPTCRDRGDRRARSDRC
jgi:N-methylhydantoinase A/oxoprolinase/acetone carboxylase beta subunit